MSNGTHASSKNCLLSVYRLPVCVVSFLASLPFSIGIPFALWWLGWQSGVGTGESSYFELPGLEQIFYMLCFVVVSLPFVISFLFFMIPSTVITGLVGLDFSVGIPVPNGTLNVDGGLFIAGLLATIVQVVSWALPVCTIALLVHQSVRTYRSEKHRKCRA